LLLAVVHAAGGYGGLGFEPAATGVPTGPGACVPGLLTPAALPGERPAVTNICLNFSFTFVLMCDNAADVCYKKTTPEFFRCSCPLVLAAGI